MKTLEVPPVRRSAERRCPECGAEAAVHARMTRAIHDWEITFVECARVRCCGRTFTVAPEGLTPGARYSDRVVRLARALTAMGTSVRAISRILRDAGVVVTAQTVHAWGRGVEPRARARANVAPAPQGHVNVRLRENVWLALSTRAPRQIERILREEWR